MNRPARLRCRIVANLGWHSLISITLANGYVLLVRVPTSMVAADTGSDVLLQVGIISDSSHTGLTTLVNLPESLGGKRVRSDLLIDGPTAA